MGNTQHPALSIRLQAHDPPAGHAFHISAARPQASTYGLGRLGAAG